MTRATVPSRDWSPIHPNVAQPGRKRALAGHKAHQTIWRSRSLRLRAQIADGVGSAT